MLTFDRWDVAPDHAEPMRVGDVHARPNGTKRVCVVQSHNAFRDSLLNP